MSKRLLPGSAHEALDRMFDSIGRSHGFAPSEGVYIAASLIDVSHWTLRAQLDPDKKGSEISYAKVVQFTRAFGCTDAAEHLATCAGGVFVPMPADGDAVAALTADAMREMGEAVAKIFASASPASEGGMTITAGEARAALPEVRDALVALSNLYSRLADKARG